MAVTQQLLLAGEEAEQAPVPWRAPEDCQDAFHTRGLLLGPLKKQPANTAEKLHSAYIIIFFLLWIKKEA